jgi:hypothetical protein
MDAIESGIVKIPRVPIADNAMTGDYPKYRDLWVHVPDGLKDLRRGPEEAGKPPLLPGLLEGALRSLYGHDARKFAEWEADEESGANGSTPPVFIVVCNNTNVSKAVFDDVAGYETAHTLPDGEPVVAGGDALPLFGNMRGNRWLHRPNTILQEDRVARTPGSDDHGRGPPPEQRGVARLRRRPVPDEQAAVPDVIITMDRRRSSPTGRRSAEAKASQTVGSPGREIASDAPRRRHLLGL